MDALIELAEAGPVRARDLEPQGIPRTYLRRLWERGVLERVDRGVYRLADAPITEHHSLAVVATRVPHGTICLLSALSFHELTMELPHSVWLMIERQARTPQLVRPTVEVVRASGRAFDHGVERHRIEGVEVRVTSPAKTVADCFRYRRHVGLEVAIEALRDYLSVHRDGVRELVEAARADRIYAFMRPYLEALV